MKTKQGRYKERKRKLGICRDCTLKATHGVYCTGHREKYNELSRVIIKRRIEQELCIRCGGTTCADSTRYCVLHFAEIKKAMEKPDVFISGALAKVLGIKWFDKEKIKGVKDILRKYTNHSDLILSDRHATILELRVLSHYPMILDDLGKNIFNGISRERVRQLEAQLGNKLLNFLTAKNYIEKLRSHVN